MIDDLTAEEIRNVLKLEPRATCSFMRVTFVSEKLIAPDGLPSRATAGRRACHHVRDD
jgi:hypothetical protein